ncbi:hypothetical protein BBJ28_00018160 [Nothophytophthora sp. Chile5]|nr:hypothetical protein BBJ28_00018160 [Nothophytophthora sp. Chile5]
MVTTTDGVSMKIVHSMLVTGDTTTLVRFLPAALMRTFNMHPRMRALQVKSKDFAAEIQPFVTLDVVAKDLLRVRQFDEVEVNGNPFAKWEKYAEDECNLSFDRYSQFPFYLTVWVDEKAERARLLLFSDHFMSDGYSGMVVLNCILEQVALLAKQSGAKQPLEYPLRPSVYKMWLSKVTWAKPLVKLLIALLGSMVYREVLKKFKPLLSARADQQDFAAPPKTNSTNASFAQGDPECMRKALARCKEENVTFAGALVSAIVLAFYHAAKSQSTFKETKPFKLTADLDYNMRLRVPRPAEEEQVGMYVAIADLEWLATEGVDLQNTRFWALAHRAKLEIDERLHHTLTMAAPTFMMDRRLNAQLDPAFVKAVPILHSQTSDVNISSVGRYPFKKEHSFVPEEQETAEEHKGHGLAVTSLHVYNSVPHLSPSATILVCSVDSFNYAMADKCEDTAAKALFTALVKITENSGSIGKNETLQEVLTRLEL